MIDPRAKVARKLTLKTNAAGVIAFDHALPAFADTGHWRVQLTVADKPLAAYDLQVEEFVPERMKVTVDAEDARGADRRQGRVRRRRVVPVRRQRESTAASS